MLAKQRNKENTPLVLVENENEEVAASKKFAQFVMDKSDLYDATIEC